MQQPPPKRTQPVWVEPAPKRPLWPGAPSGRMTAGLVGLSGAAILAVYAVGYVNTDSGTTQLTTTRLPGDTGAPGSSGGSRGNGQNGVTAPNADPNAGPRVQRGPFDFGGDDGDRRQVPGVQPTPAGPSQVQPAPTATPTQLPATNPRTAPGGSAQQASGLHDGTFVGVGNSRHGGMQVSVIVKDGRIVSANVTGCGTRYPCSKINPLISEVVNRQSAPVDYVSGATDSSTAYIQAVRTALAHASAQAS